MHKYALALNQLVMITEKQKNNLYNLPVDDIIDIMHICAESLGVVSVKQYCDMFEIERTKVYRLIKSKKIRSVNIGGSNLPVVNC